MKTFHPVNKSLFQAMGGTAIDRHTKKEKCLYCSEGNSLKRQFPHLKKITIMTPCCTVVVVVK